MSYSVYLTSSFKRSIRTLKKSYRGVQHDVEVAVRLLIDEPRLGVVIPGGAGIRKLRVRNSDIGKGKSSGYRLIYLVQDEPKKTLYLLLLYSKTMQADVTRRELQSLLDELDTDLST